MPRPAYDLAPIPRRNLGPSAWPLRQDWIHAPDRVLGLIETMIPQFEILYLSRERAATQYVRTIMRQFEAEAVAAGLVLA